ncbi:erythromycin resistance leader peptide [Bacillus sp. FJAT-22090]
MTHSMKLRFPTLNK